MIDRSSSAMPSSVTGRMPRRCAGGRGAAGCCVPARLRVARRGTFHAMPAGRPVNSVDPAGRLLVDQAEPGSDRSDRHGFVVAPLHEPDPGTKAGVALALIEL